MPTTEAEKLIDDPGKHDHVFLGARLSVKIDGTVFAATVEDISLGEQSGERLFGIRYDDGDYEDVTENELITRYTFLELRGEASEKDPLKFNGDLKRLLTSGMMSDVALKVRGEEVHAHKLILSARSPVFRNMFSSGMAEQATQTVTIEDISVRIVRLLCEYVYSGSIEDGSVWEDDALVRELTYAALKYECQDLSQACCHKAVALVTVGNVCDFLILATQAHPQGKLLMYHCLKITLNNMSEVQDTDGWANLMGHKQLLPEVMSLIMRTAFPPKIKRQRTV